MRWWPHSNKPCGVRARSIFTTWIIHNLDDIFRSELSNRNQEVVAIHGAFYLPSSLLWTAQKLNGDHLKWWPYWNIPCGVGERPIFSTWEIHNLNDIFRSELSNRNQEVVAIHGAFYLASSLLWTAQKLNEDFLKWWPHSNKQCGVRERSIFSTWVIHNLNDIYQFELSKRNRERVALHAASHLLSSLLWTAQKLN